MQTFDDIKSFSSAGFKATALTIGNFDGCHLGHQTLLREIRDLASANDLLSLAFTFSPRPEAFFLQKASEQLLFTDEQKSRAFEELGISAHIRQAFDQNFAMISHESFLKDIIIKSLKSKALIVGENFRFGHRRLGDSNYLKKSCAEAGITFICGKSALFEDQVVSSTRIRNLIALEGDMEQASSLLGRPYLLEGVIRQGDQLGRSLGFPTLNLEITQQLIPAYGVYVGYIFLGSNQDKPTVLNLDKEALPAVFNIGVRPTLKDKAPQLRVEGHLIDRQLTLNSYYNQSCGFYLCHRLRDELKFPDLEALKKQIAKDIQNAKRYF